MKKNNFDLFDIVPLLIIVIVVIGFVGAPIAGVIRVTTTQQALNQECGTNYNFIQVALSGDNLSRLCQIKNQTITVK
jgi:hypothetical protein